MSMIKNNNVRPAILHKIRQLARTSNPEIGYQAVGEVDMEMGSLLLQGYRLVSTHYLGTQHDERMNENYTGILYVFQLEQSEIEKLRKEQALVPQN